MIAKQFLIDSKAFIVGKYVLIATNLALLLRKILALSGLFLCSTCETSLHVLKNININPPNTAPLYDLIIYLQIWLRYLHNIESNFYIPKLYGK